MKSRRMTRLQLQREVERTATDCPFTMPFFLAGLLLKECRRQKLRRVNYTGEDYKVTVTIKP